MICYDLLGQVSIRGSKAAVDQASSLLEAFKIDNYIIKIPCLDEDFPLIFGSTENDSSAQSSAGGCVALSSRLESAYEVAIVPMRKEGFVRITGPTLYLI